MRQRDEDGPAAGGAVPVWAPGASVADLPGDALAWWIASSWEPGWDATLLIAPPGRQCR